MSEIVIRGATPTDKEPIAQLIASVNKAPANHNLHCGQEESDILEEIAMLEVPLEESFLVATRNGEMIGVLGADITLERDKGWLWGPFVTDENWEETAESLYTQFAETLGADLTQITHFLNLTNDRTQAFFRGKGYFEVKKTHVYQALPPAAFEVEPLPEIIPPEWRSFIALHEATFPGTYLNGRQIIERLDKQNKLFVCADGETVLGYIYANVEPTEGYIHFLGVEEESRGQGYGKRLLMTAVSWLFNTLKVPQIGLAVDDENNARHLYERCGFGLLFSGVGLRKEK